MERRLAYILVLLFTAGCSTDLEEEKVYYKAMTYNIRYDNPYDGENNWHKRKAELVAQIQKESPDILGTQEAHSHQLHYLDSTLTDYQYVNVGKTHGERTALFYKSSTWNCLQGNIFWLSETPDSISVGWDAALKRICTCALLENKNCGKKVWVFNTHFNHIGKLARENSAKLVLKQIKKVQRKRMIPVILMGDFNATPKAKPILLLSKKLKSSFSDAEQGTFNGFNNSATIMPHIDYIFTKNLKIEGSKTLKETRKNGRFISDHFPVTLSFRFE